MFEYKTPPREQQNVNVKETSAPNDNLLKFTLLQRLEAMDERLEIKQEPDTGPDVVSSFRGYFFKGSRSFGILLSSPFILYISQPIQRYIVTVRHGMVVYEQLPS